MPACTYCHGAGKRRANGKRNRMIQCNNCKGSGRVDPPEDTKSYRVPRTSRDVDDRNEAATGGFNPFEGLFD